MPSADEKRGLLASIKHGVLGILRRIGVTLAYLFGLARDEQVRLLTDDTARLGSSAVESSAYVEVSLRKLDEDVQELRREVAGLRRLLEGGEHAEAELRRPAESD